MSNGALGLCTLVVTLLTHVAGALGVANALLDAGANVYTPTAAARGGTTSAHYVCRSTSCVSPIQRFDRPFRQLARIQWSAAVEQLCQRVFGDTRTRMVPILSAFLIALFCFRLMFSLLTQPNVRDAHGQV